MVEVFEGCGKGLGGSCRVWVGRKGVKDFRREIHDLESEEDIRISDWRVCSTGSNCALEVEPKRWRDDGKGR